MPEIKKISSHSFNNKIRVAKRNHKEKLEKLKKEFIKKKSKITSSDEKRKLILSYRKKKNRELNRYALNYNSVIDEKMYRKTIMIFKIGELRDKFRIKKRQGKINDLKIEKEKLNNKIYLIKEKYSKPISLNFRRNRSPKTEETRFVKLKINTPTKKYIKSFLLILLAAFLTSVANDIFIKPFGLYNSGLRGITQMFFYMWKYFIPSLSTSMSYIIFLIANVPLIIFGWIKVGKKFTLFTLLFISIQFAISSAMDFSGLTRLIAPFGEESEWIYNHIQNASSGFNTFKHVLPFISVIIGGVLYGTGIGLVFKAGGSNGGSKFIVTWYAAKTGKSIGFVSILVSVFVIWIGSTINRGVIEGQNFITVYTSATIFASIVFAFVVNITLNKTFPKSKKKEIKILTSKFLEISRFLDVHYLYNRSFTTFNINSGFKSKNLKTMSFILTDAESKTLVSILSQIDKKAIITVSELESVKGKFYIKWYE